MLITMRIYLCQKSCGCYQVSYLVYILAHTLDISFTSATAHPHRIVYCIAFTMPSIPYSNALFAAGTEFWKYPKWEERTNIAIPPFSPEATPQNTGLNVREISAVKAFSERIHNIKPLAKLIEALSNKRDNDADGRSAWETWIKRNFDSWHIVQDVEAVLVAEGRHPRQLIGQQGFVSAELSLHDL